MPANYGHQSEIAAARFEVESWRISIGIILRLKRDIILKKILTRSGADSSRQDQRLRIKFEVMHKYRWIRHIWILPASFRQVHILLLIHPGHVP
jgi:hypothetical protein